MKLAIGRLPHGEKNSICDVSGIKVGHCTIDNERHKTGVTVVLPCEDDIFRRKMIAACHVLNGFGKTTGLMQLEELGTLETPIAMTNTLGVGLVHDAVVEYMEQRAESCGYSISSMNPVVTECNDASLNDIRTRAVGESEVFAAIRSADTEFAQGDVGAGKGMTCFGLKGGIGTASRLVTIGGEEFTVGVLLLTNFGSLRDFRIAGKDVGEEIQREMDARERAALSETDKGSCIMLLATDVPMSSRQLKRVIRRCSVGLVRLGGYIGHGSGEVMIGFSTANRVPADAEIIEGRYISENCIERVFRAAAEASEEAVLQSMLNAHTVTGSKGITRHALTEYMTEAQVEALYTK